MDEYINHTAQYWLRWTFLHNQPTIVTSSFGKYSAVLLHMVSQINPCATILWLDTQFNTSATIAFKERITEKLNLNVVRYTGELWDTVVPDPNSAEHQIFVEQVKLAAFRRAVHDLAPAFWISGIRREQTEVRQQAQYVSRANGITKVCPLLDWRVNDMKQYLQKYELPNEPDYYDPTKPDEHSECGLHITR